MTEQPLDLAELEKREPRRGMVSDRDIVWITDSERDRLVAALRHLNHVRLDDTRDWREALRDCNIVDTGAK